MDNTIIQYSTRDSKGWGEGGGWRQAYGDPRAFTSGLVCSLDTIVYELELVECPEEDDWDFVGWRYSPEFGDPENVTMVFPSFRAFEMCFTYGVQAEIDRGKGEIVYMRLVDARELGTARELRKMY